YPRHSPPLTVMARPHPRATLFPYTTLFRSSSQTADICVGSTVDLSLQNMTLGSGVSYQWYASTDGGANWVPMGPNAATWSPTITGDVSFYCEVTCDSEGSASSTPVSVLALSDFCLCGEYGASASTGCCEDDSAILNVTVGSMNAPVSCTEAPPGSVLLRYHDYTTSVTGPDIAQGETVSASV